VSQSRSGDTDLPYEEDDTQPVPVVIPPAPDGGIVAIVPAPDEAAALPPSPPPPGPPPGQVAAVVPPPGPPPVLPPPMPVEVKEGPGLLVRAVWFVFVGWWLSALVSTVAWVALVTIIGIPLGIWLINRIPTVITLRPRTRELQQVIDASGIARFQAVPIQQQPWWLRGIWFLFVGWWASAIVMIVGWVLLVLILTLPVGLWMFNRVPFVASLYRY
jgi:uncharacterized membrane protein YccF (DUF307 family)